MRARGKTSRRGRHVTSWVLHHSRERIHRADRNRIGETLLPAVPFPNSMVAEGIDKLSAEFRGWLTNHKIRILNVAGNRESQNPGLQEFTRTFLISALRSFL